MGTWGPAIFADDDAEDLRDEYRHILADAQSDNAATDAAMAEYGAAFDRLEATTSNWVVSILACAPPINKIIPERRTTAPTALSGPAAKSPAR